MTALNGVYRSMYFSDNWSAGYVTENFGNASVNLCADVMGEDMVIREPGSYWFIYDQLYWVREEINNKSDRPYTWWSMFYQFINNANNIIDKIENAEGNEKTLMNLKAQALSLRAFGYFNLIIHYQRTYVGHEQDPGAPLYIEATVSSTTSKGRGTVKDVYDQINKDLDLSIHLFD